MESKNSEVLTKENYETNSYKELKLIIGQKLISRILMNPKITEGDVQEYNDIMQSAMDERSEYDSEKLLPIIIPDQLYPNNRVHKFYAPVEYKKSPIVVQAMHRACVIFNLYVEKRQSKLVKRSRNDAEDPVRRVSPRITSSSSTMGGIQHVNTSTSLSGDGGIVDDNFNVVNGTGNSNKIYTKEELTKLKKDEVLSIYRKVLALPEDSDIDANKDVLITEIIVTQGRSITGGAIMPATTQRIVTDAVNNDEDSSLVRRKDSLKLTIIWTLLQNFLTFPFINELLEECAIDQTEFWKQGAYAYPLFLKIRLIIMALGTKKYLSSDHTRSTILHEAKNHPGIMADTLEAYKDVKRTFKGYIDRLEAVSSDQDTVVSFAEEINYAFIKALLRKFDGGWIHTSVSLVNNAESTWTTKQTIDSLAVKISNMLNIQKQTGFHAAMVTRDTPILSAITSTNVNAMVATIVCTFCSALHAKGIKLFDQLTRQVTREIKCNHSDSACILRHCKHCRTTFATPDQFHSYNQCPVFNAKVNNNANAYSSNPNGRGNGFSRGSPYNNGNNFTFGNMNNNHGNGVSWRNNSSGRGGRNYNPRGYPRSGNAYMANNLWTHEATFNPGYPNYQNGQFLIHNQGQYPRPSIMMMNNGPPMVPHIMMNNNGSPMISGNGSQYNMIANTAHNSGQNQVNNRPDNHNDLHNQVRILSPTTHHNTHIFAMTHNNQAKLIVDSGATESAINEIISKNVQQLLPKITTIKPRKLVVHGINNYTATIDRALLVALQNGDDIVHNIMQQQHGLLSVHKLNRQLKIKMLFDENKLDILDNNTNAIIETVYQDQGLYTMTIPQYIKLLKRMTNTPLEEIFDSLENKTIFIGSAFHRIILTDKIKKFISDIHQNYGHPGTSRLIATILSNVAFRNLDFSQHMELQNPFILAAVIRKYYSKHHCIVCLIANKKRRIPRYNIITDIPDHNFETCYIDWKGMSHIDRYGNIGTHILVCKRSTYVLVRHVTSVDPETTVDVIKQFVTEIKTLGYEIRTLFSDGTSSYQPAARLLQVNIQPLAANSQYRNNAERTIQVVYSTYAKNYSAQYLLDHAFWSDGIDTAVSQYNITVNEKTEDVTPHELIFNSAPVIPAYKYGQPVIVSKNAHKIDSKIIHNIGRGFPAVVIGIDNTNLYGAKVYKCGTYDGTIVGRNLIALHDDMDKLDSKYDKLEIISKFGIPKITGSRRKRFHIDLDEYKRDVEPPPPDLEITVVTPDEYDTDNDEVMYTINATSNDLVCSPCNNNTTNLLDHMQLKPQNMSDLSTEITENEYDTMDDREPTVKKALMTGLQHKWINAIHEEISKLQQYNIGHILDKSLIPLHTQIIPTKFALTIKKKYTDGQLRFYTRARLCGRGDLQLEYEQQYSPTIRLIVVLIILALHVQYDYALLKFDVVGAFLQTPVTDEDIYVSLPLPIFNRTIIKLQKYLYGLKSSNQKFYQYFSRILIDYGMKCIQEVEALFTNDDIILLLHVDDGILIDKSIGNIASTKLLQYINSRCEIQTTYDVSEYLKLYITKIPDGIKLHQTPTVDKMHIEPPTFTQLHKFMKLDLEVIPNIPISTTYIEQRREYVNSPHYLLINPTIIQHITGTLIHISYITRPTLQLALQLISKHQNEATEYDLYHAYKLVQYTKATKDQGIIYRKCNKNDFCITMISDAAHMFHDNLFGQTAYSITLGHCLLTTNAKKASRPTLSAMETETHAHTNGARNFIYTNMLLQQLSTFATLEKPKFITDSLSLLKLIHRKRLYTDRIKHFINELSYLKYVVDTYNVTTIHCTTDIMIMDILTKLNTKNTRSLTLMLYDIKQFFNEMSSNNTAIIDTNTQNEYSAMTDDTLIMHLMQQMNLR